MADPRLVETLERLVVGAVGITAVALAECAPAADLTLPQWRALLVVARGDGVRIGEVGSRVGMGLPSASRIVRRLERRGLVTTARDESDRRGTLVHPTAAGLHAWEQLVQYRRRMISQLLDALPEQLPVDITEDLERLEQAFAQYS